jgi:hypothetical protein
MSGSLLSHIAGNFISQYENVANSSICYLLNKYPSAREALKKRLSLSKIPDFYKTEQSTRSNGRPDIVGTNENGDISVIIEGKFWANLTDNQPVNYLKELTNSGKLMFLAPQKRIKSLQCEIEKRIQNHDDRIDICSWNEFLNLVDIANSKGHDADLESDLNQLKELCEIMDIEGMPPLSITDLDPMNGRIIYQFADLIEECNSFIRQKWDKADFKGTKLGGFKEGYGFYFKVSNNQYWLGVSWYNWYTKNCHTPIWLYIYANKTNSVDKIFSRLNQHDSSKVIHSNDRVMCAIDLQPGMDKDAMIDCIYNKTKNIISISEPTENKFPEHLKKFIENEKWTFAKTMQDWPHEYIIRDRVDEKLFEEIVSHIRTNGYIGSFYKMAITYFNEDGFVYWTMGAPLNETTIINRCAQENTYQARLKRGKLPPANH